MTDKCDVCGRFMSDYRYGDWVCSQKCVDILNKECEEQTGVNPAK